MAKKAASLKKQLADGIKLILLVASVPSLFVFLSAIGLGREPAGVNRYRYNGSEWAESIADIFGTSLTGLGFFSLITFVVSLGLAIFIHKKFSPEEELFGSMPEIDPNEPKQTKQKQTPQNPTGSPVFEFAPWFLAILFVFAVGLTLWKDVIALLL